MHVDRQMTDADPALRRLRAFIAEGRFHPGDRIPPERELIERLGLSRTALRRALDGLEQEGAIWRRVGKGTFLSDGLSNGGSTRGGTGGDRMIDLARRTTPVKMMQARLVVEPSIAREAAINASANALDRIGAAQSAARATTTWAGYEAADDVFHRAIAEAADNLPLLSLFDQLNLIRRSVTWGSVERTQACPPPDHSSFDEHDRIAGAIAARDGAGAQLAMQTHLKSVSARLFGG